MKKSKTKIFLATDHAGFELKEHVKRYLQKLGFNVVDKGAYAYDKDDDYPDFIAKAAKNVADTKGSKGIIFGGSGQGETIVANKFKGVRAAVFYGNNLEIIKRSRTHNDANVLSIGARFTTKETAIKAIELWLNTEFSNEPRHERRLKKIVQLEKSLK